MLDIGHTHTRTHTHTHTSANNRSTNEIGLELRVSVFLTEFEARQPLVWLVFSKETKWK